MPDDLDGLSVDQREGFWRYERAGWVWDGTRSDHQVQCLNLPIVRYAVPL